MGDTAGTIYRMTVEQMVHSVVTINNTMWYNKISADEDLSAVDLLTDWRINVLPMWRAAHYTQVHVRKLTVEKMWPAVETPVSELYAAGTYNGLLGGIGSVLPPVCCLLLPLRAGATRRLRGRMYFSPCAWNGLTVAINRWDTAPVNGVNNWAALNWNRYHFGAEDAKWEWGVWSRATGGWPPVTPAGFTALPAAPTVLDTTIRLQRSREQ